VQPTLHALDPIAGHDRAEGSGVRPVVTCRAEVPVEFGTVDRTVAGVYHGHFGELLYSFVFFVAFGVEPVRLRDKYPRRLGNATSGYVTFVLLDEDGDFPGLSAKAM
jgi:hypothetical protein